MICAKGATKRFGDVLAVDHIDAEIQAGSVFGLIGSNGAGKSTFLRMLAGILKPDEGRVLMEEQDIFENVPVKQRCFYISDEQYFFANCTPDELRGFYKRMYHGFDDGRFAHLMEGFGLDRSRKIRTFSKGMKKQVSVICGISANVEYLFCDETFDGLDPVARQAVKALFAEGVAEGRLTPIIASHNLRELEDICDHVGLLHKGGILFSRDLEDMKLGIHKIQCILPAACEFRPDYDLHQVEGVEVLRVEQRGSLYTITARGARETLERHIAALGPIFLETLPLTLEEIFISETEVVGYDIKKLIL